MAPRHCAAAATSAGGLASEQPHRRERHLGFRLIVHGNRGENQRLSGCLESLFAVFLDSARPASVRRQIPIPLEFQPKQNFHLGKV